MPNDAPVRNWFEPDWVAPRYAAARPDVHARVVARLRPFLSRARVRLALDAGCGTGLSTRPLAAIAERVVGLDPAVAAVESGTCSLSELEAGLRAGLAARVPAAGAEFRFRGALWVLARRHRLSRDARQAPRRTTPAGRRVAGAGAGGFGVDWRTAAAQKRSTGGAMKLSARNQLAGTVRSVEHGAVNSEVVIEIAGGVEIVAVVTRRSAESLGLAPGRAATAVVKASQVLVATDD